MSFHWFVARRYLWSKRRHPFVGVVSTISIIGITMGVAALITVLALGVMASTWQAVRATRAETIVETEAARSAQVAQFLKDMLKGVGPSVSRGRDATLLREILIQSPQRFWLRFWPRG